MAQTRAFCLATVAVLAPFLSILSGCTSVYWNRTYGNSDRQYFADVIASTTGPAYVAAGARYESTYIPGASNPRQGWLIKVDANGQFNTDHEFGTLGKDDALSAVVTRIAIPGYAATGVKTVGNKGEALLMVFNANLSVANEETWGGASGTRYGPLDLIKSGGTTVHYVLVGSTGRSGDTSADGLMIRTDANPNNTPGSPRTYDGPIGNGATFSAVADRPAAGLFYVGLVGKNPTPPFGSHGWLVTTDANGSASGPEWHEEQIVNSAASGGGLDWLVDIAPLPTGGYLAVGHTDRTGGGDGWIVEVNGSGQFVQEWTHGGSGDDWFRAVIPIAGGKFAAVGVKTVSGMKQQGWLLIFEEANPGAPVQDLNFGGIEDDEFASVIETSDGGLLMAGYTTDSNDVDAWLVKTDANGGRAPPTPTHSP